MDLGGIRHMWSYSVEGLLSTGPAPSSLELRSLIINGLFPQLVQGKAQVSTCYIGLEVIVM